jgi:Zn finger protein HypA/HybF involved in hydrogenase expression
MAIIKVNKSINVEDIYCRVTCPECDGNVNMRMKGPSTRKNCPKCGQCTYVFSIDQMREGLVITVTTIGKDNTPREYALSPTDVEVE